MSTPQRFGPFDVNERTTFKLATKVGEPIKDENGVAIAGSAVATCTLVLYDLASGTVIKGATPLNILNANGGTWDANGNFTLLLDPADNAILDAALAFEQHIALIQYTYATSKAGKLEAVLSVRNLQKVP